MALLVQPIISTAILNIVGRRDARIAYFPLPLGYTAVSFWGAQARRRRQFLMYDLHACLMATLTSKVRPTS